MSTNVIGRLKHLITGLSPYQLVKVQISASTAIGEGPRSEHAEGRSEESGKRPDLSHYCSEYITHDCSSF